MMHNGNVSSCTHQTARTEAFDHNTDERHSLRCGSLFRETNTEDWRSKVKTATNCSCSYTL